MLIGWLKDIEDGHFAADLIPLELSGSFGKRFNGQGRLVWTRDDIRIEAATDGGDELLRDLMSGIPVKPGQLLPADYYLRLSGTTRDGWEVVIERLDSHCHSTVSGHPSAVWQFGKSEINSWVHFHATNTSDKLKGVSEALMGPNELRSWPRSSETVYSNPHFGVKGAQFDWLEFECDFGQVAAQKRDSGLIRLRIEHDGQLTLSNIDAVRMAFSYLGGKMLSLLALESWGEDRKKRVLPTTSHSKRRNRFHSPLDHDGNAVAFYERFLARMSSLFSTTRGQHIANLLYACEDSVDNTFTTSAMVLCSSIEAIIEPYAKPAQTGTVLTKSQKKRVVELLETEGFSEEVLKRIAGLLGMLDQVSVKNVLRSWVDSGKLGITVDDIKAWGHLRNRAMHGRLLMEHADVDRRQEDVSASQRVTNLLNKLILNEAGYEGKYFDYTSWEYTDFVPEDLSLSNPE